MFWWRYCEIQWSGNFQTLYIISTKRKDFGNKIYKHNDVTGYTCSTVSYSTQTATDELMMHTINCSNRINSIVKVLMYVLFMMMRIWALWYCTTYSHYTSHVSWHTLHMTAHMCTQNFSLQGSELNLRPYINCVWFWKLLTHSLTPWSRVLLEKLTDLQPVKKFPVFYGTRRFITTFYVIKFMLEV